MCFVCSRRAVVFGGLCTLTFTGSESFAVAPDRIACGFDPNDDPQRIRASMTSTPPSDAGFHDALVGELQNILQAMPAISPGFQYVSADNAGAVTETYVGGTRGTVLIGIALVQKLLGQPGGGIAVAGVLAHECAHIFQYFSPYYDLLKGFTPVRLELHADALAGWYLARKLGANVELLSPMTRTLMKMGTYNSTSATFHGTPGFRDAALEEGYLLGRGGATFELAASESEKFVHGMGT
jgi:hypothetical protein